MIKRLLRLLTKPPGRWLVVLLFVAGTWFVWWISPLNPLRRIVLMPGDIPRSARIVGSGNTMFVETYRRDNAPQWGCSLVNINDGRTICRKKQSRIGLSPDGKHLVFDEDDHLAMIDTDTGKEVWHSNPFPFDRKSLLAQGSMIRFSADGSRFAAEGPDAAVFETATGGIVARFPEAAGPVDMSADGRTLASGIRALPMAVALWDVASRQRKTLLDDSTTGILCAVRLSPDQNRIVRQTAGPSWDLPIDVWDVKEQKIIGTNEAMRRPEFSRSGRFVVDRPASSVDTVMELEPGPDGSHLFDNPFNIGRVLADESKIIVVKRDGWWSVHDGKSNKQLARGPLGGFERANLSSDGRWVYRHLIPQINQEASLRTRIWNAFNMPPPLDHQLWIHDAQTGKQVSYLPVSMPILTDPSRSTFWTTQAHNMGIATSTFAVEEYPLKPETLVPSWLWIVTALAVGLIGIDARRCVRARQSASRLRSAARPLAGDYDPAPS